MRALLSENSSYSLAGTGMHNDGGRLTEERRRHGARVALLLGRSR